MNGTAPAAGLTRRGLLTVAALAIAFAAAWSALAIWRHSIFNSSMYDLALFDQLVWNMAHGRFFESSIKGFYYLGDHVSPALVLLGPLYWLWDDVRMLLIFQAFAIAVSAIPFYAAAAETLESEAAGVLMAAVFLLQPNLGYLNLFDFHPEILLVPAFTFALFLLRRGRPWGAIACALAALTIKEDAAITAACFGILVFFTRSRTAGAVLVAASIAWFFVAMYVIIPAYRPAGAAAGYLYMERYAHLGATIPEVVKNAILDPYKALVEPYERWKGITFVRMFLPTAFLAFAGLPTLLVALPVLGYSYISMYLPQFDVRYQYITVAVPFIMFAALDGIRRVLGPLDRLGVHWGQRWLSRAIAVRGLPAALVALNVLSVYWIYHSHDQTQSFKAPPNLAELREAVALIPKDASVATLNTLGPHLSHRRSLEFAVPFTPHWYHYEKLKLPMYSTADWQLFNLRDRRWTRDGLWPRINELKDKYGYAIVYNRNSVMLLSRTKGATPK